MIVTVLLYNLNFSWPSLLTDPRESAVSAKTPAALSPMIRSLLRLWCHESTRTFSDRLFTEDQRHWFSSLIHETVEEFFCRDNSELQSEVFSLEQAEMQKGMQRCRVVGAMHECMPCQVYANISISRYVFSFVGRADRPHLSLKSCFPSPLLISPSPSPSPSLGGREGVGEGRNYFSNASSCRELIFPSSIAN